MKKLVQLYLLLLLVSLGWSKNVESHSAAEIKAVHVVPSGGNLRIEVKLSSAVSPRVTMASNPDRLVLDLPNTIAEARQKHIAVNQSGVKELRIALTSSDPVVTRLVVDLDQARPYGLSSEGDTIALTVLPAVAGEAGVAPERGLYGTAGDLSGAMRVSPAPAVTRPASKHVQVGFKVKYIAEGVVYLAGGRSSGLEEGMTLIIPDSRKGGTRALSAAETSGAVAELKVISVAETSALTEVHEATREVKSGDWAYLSVEETEAVLQKKVTGGLRNRKQASASNPMEPDDGEALMAQTPRAPAPMRERVRGRIGFDYSGISGSLGSSTMIGVIARSDITNIMGTHWNLNGYWRGRMTKHSRMDEPTLQNYLNKTYTMQLTYDNPNSPWVAGFGRLYLPWANSMDTIDGGYLGRRVGHGITVGGFAGSTPDPTSWHYNPDRRIAGTFVNFEGGSYDSFRYSSTTGITLSTIKWNLDRPFLFFENGISYKKYLSVYHSLTADAPQGLTTDGITPGAGISRSYLTVHVQPHERVGFDFYHNYFRDVPTAATALIGTGLVDKLLYQGISFGVRVEPVKHYWVYTTLGQSEKTGDTRRALNQMYGFTVDEIAHTGMRADVHYSKFDSSFGRGDYALLTLSRHLGDRMMWDLQLGNQRLNSPFTSNTSQHFVDTSFDMNLWGKSFIQSGYTVLRGDQMNYNQWYMSLGYRFDSQPGVK